MDRLEPIRALRDVYEEALEHADEKRRDYHREVKKLHHAGVPLREIAEALGMSHQRVHQIVGTGGPKRRSRRVAGGVAVLVLLVLLIGGMLSPVARPQQGTVEKLAEPELVPTDLILYDSPEAAAYAAALNAYPWLRYPEVRLVLRFPPPNDDDTRVKVRHGEFCRIYGSQENRPGEDAITTGGRGWVAWGGGSSCFE